MGVGIGLVLSAAIWWGCGKDSPFDMMRFSPQQDSFRSSSPSASSAHPHVEKGAVLTVVLQTPLSSERSMEGDPVKAILADDVLDGDRVALKKGTEVYGEVIEVLPAVSSSEKTGKLSFVFNGIDGPTNRIPATLSVLSAKLEQSAADQTARTRTRMASTAVGAILGGKIASNENKSKGKGAVVGGAAGLLVGSLIADQQGVDVEMPIGSRIKLRVDHQISVK